MNRVGSRPVSARSRRDPPEATDDDDYSEDGDELNPVVGAVFDNDDEDVQDDEVDLDGYEEYLARLRSEPSERPKSASHARPMPSESPQFYMVNVHNLAGPAPPPTCHPPSAPRPSRPASARPRLRSDCAGEQDPRAADATVRLGTRGGVRPSPGIRRKRQTGDAVNPCIRAVYQKGGRASTAGIKRLPTSAAALATISSKSHVFQQAELHDEYFKLVDVVSELKSACQLEQERRVKAIARVRRLEEIVTLKDRKIESLLQARVGGGSVDLGAGGVLASLAQRDRQHNALVQKLRVKIAQQAQMLGAYEDALQTLRSGTKSTNLMELEEERGQLYQELHRLQALLSLQRHEISTHGEQIGCFADVQVNYKEQIAKLQEANKMAQHEKHKLEQEIAVYKSRAESLQQQLSLEQRKRAYDQQVGSNGHTHTPTISSPNRAVMLSRAIEDMKVLLRKESAASIQRDKLKSPRSGAASAPRAEKAATSTLKLSNSAAEASAHIPKIPARTGYTSGSSQRAQSRPTSATPTRPQTGRASMLPTVAAPTELDADLNAACASQEGEKADETSPTTEESMSEVVVGVDTSAIVTLLHPQVTEHPVFSPDTSQQDNGSDSLEGKRPDVAPECDGTSDVLQRTDRHASAVSSSEQLDRASMRSISALGDADDSGHDRGDTDSETNAGGDDPNVSESNPAVQTPTEQAANHDAKADSEEIHRQKLAEVERMLREVDDDMDNDLESNSSEEFLEIAQLHTSDQPTDTANDCAVEDHQDNAGEASVKPAKPRQPTLSPSSSSSSSSSPSSSSSTSRSSESQSASSASLLHDRSVVCGDEADVEDHTLKTVDTSDDVLAGASVGRVASAHSIAHEPSGYEDGYQSDFTEASSP